MAALLIASALWRLVRYGMGFPVWGDEAFVANNFLLKGFWGLSGALEHYQIAPLLFLWGEWLVAQVLGVNEWGLRALPLVGGLAALALSAVLALKTLPRSVALIAIAIFAASYYPARYAVEIKPYSLDLLVAIAITLLGWLSARNNGKQLPVALALVCVVGVWVSYPSVFVTAGVLFTLALRAMVRKQTTTLWALILIGVLAAISFIAMYATVGVTQYRSGPVLTTDWAEAFPPFEDIGALSAWLLRIHTGKLFAYPNGGADGGSVLTFVLFCLGGIWLWRRKQKYLLTLLLAPFVFTFVAASFKLYPYGLSPRVAQHLAPAICLLAGAGVASLLMLGAPGLRRYRRRVAITCLVCMLLVAAGVTRDVVKPYKFASDHTNRELAVQLARTNNAKQWIVFGRFAPVAHAPDLSRWAGAAARFRFYLLKNQVVPVHWAPDRTAISALSGRTWFIVYRHPEAPFPDEQLGAYLNWLKAGLGPVAVGRSYTLKHGAERIDVYDFSAL